MKNARTPPDPPQAKGPQGLIDVVAATVLWLVIASLGWIMLAASNYAWLRLPSLEVEVLSILGLLVAALLLVSVVALRKT